MIRVEQQDDASGQCAICYEHRHGPAFICSRSLGELATVFRFVCFECAREIALTFAKPQNAGGRPPPSDTRAREFLESVAKHGGKQQGGAR